MSQPDPLDLAGQERTQQERLNRAQLAEKRDREDLVWLMSGKRGRRFLWRLFVAQGAFNTSFSTNAMQMSFNEGARHEANKLTTRLQLICPDFYVEMVKENTHHE